MTREGCQKYAAVELDEYWRAVRQGNYLSAEDALQLAAMYDAKDNDDFYQSYNICAHNTAIDELADLTIVAATWYEAVKRESCATGRGPQYFADLMFIDGVLAFVADRCVNTTGCENLHTVVNMKMRFNELRTKYR